MSCTVGVFDRCACLGVGAWGGSRGTKILAHPLDWAKGGPVFVVPREGG